MYRFVVFLSGIALALAAPSPVKKPCSSQTIALSANGWSIPLTSLADQQDCTFTFTVPKNYFATCDFRAYNFDIQHSEAVELSDNFNAVIRNNGPNLTSNVAWGSDFRVTLVSNGNTKLQYSVDIQIKPASPRANIVKSYVTFVGSASTFMYTEEWTEGASYQFTSKTSNIALSAGDSFNSFSMEWNNVFVYDGGNFVGSLLKIAEGFTFVSKSNNVVLYMAKKMNTVGAAMATDLSNVADIRKEGSTLLYVPNEPTFTAYLYTFGGQIESAVTVVSSRKNPQAINVVSLNTTNLNPVFSYISGGPNERHSGWDATMLNPVLLPEHITGYANTFYIRGGDGSITFALTDD